jgi:hypothetical protein
MTQYRTPKGDRDLIPWDEIIMDVRPDHLDKNYEIVETRPATVADVLAAMKIKEMLDQRREEQHG